jgi:hypothetical protein
VPESQDHIAALRLFNEKAKKLNGLSFIKAITAPNASVTVSAKRKDDGTFEVRSERRGPSQEAIDAFVLSFRFFIQDNETSSLRNIAAVYDAAALDEGLKERFRSARHAINRLLDSPNLLNISHNSVLLTNREIMDVFIYGGLAHATPEKYKRFQEWMAFPPAAVLFENCFALVLGKILHPIMYIVAVNQEAIEQLESGE